MIKWLAQNTKDPEQYTGGLLEEAETHKELLDSIRGTLVDRAMRGEYSWGDKFRVTLWKDKIIDAWTIVLRSRGMKEDPERNYFVTDYWHYMKKDGLYYRRCKFTGWDCPVTRMSDSLLAQFHSEAEYQEYLVNIKQ